jgi:hypothetical protein
LEIVGASSDDSRVNVTVKRISGDEVCGVKVIVIIQVQVQSIFLEQDYWRQKLLQ